jgi:hypothetical protein
VVTSCNAGNEPPKLPRERSPQGPCFRCILTIVVLALLMGGCMSVPAPERMTAGLLVPERFYVPGEEQLYGSWVVLETHATIEYPKMVIHPWGLVEVFESVTSTSYAWRATSTIAQKWTDEEGNIWYKEFVRWSMRGFYAGHAYNLVRISEDSGTLETISGNVGWPEPAQMDSERNTTYVKYRRLE